MVCSVAEGGQGVVASMGSTSATAAMASTVLSFSLVQHLNQVWRAFTLLSSSSHSSRPQG